MSAVIALYPFPSVFSEASLLQHRRRCWNCDETLHHAYHAGAPLHFGGCVDASKKMLSIVRGDCG
eukprot:8893354-Ditylum_brightwellii.AAC.1